MLRIVALSGSLQKASCNTGVIRALINLHHKDLDINLVDIHGIPLFDEDIEKKGVPAAVKEVADKVRAADGLIFAVPENNYSVSAPIKNTYDWLSRGGDKASVYQKPVSFVSAAAKGGIYAQQHMAKVIEFCKLKNMLEPKVQIHRFVPGNFGEDGSLLNKKIIDETLLPFLNAYAKFIKDNKVNKA